MADSILRGRCALITGASSGLGADFARELAARGCNLILVARREDLLRSLQQEVSTRHNITVESIPLDLTEEDAPQTLYDRIKAAGLSVDVLVNNAGFGLYGEFVDIPWERERNMLELDMIVLTHLTKLFVKDMVARNFGFILQVSSIGAFQPSPTYASYSAAKSYVLYFGVALNYELRKTNVRCTVLAPGIVRTEFLQVSGQQPSLYQRLVRMNSPEVVRIAVNSMLKGKSTVVPGWMNAIMARMSQLMPRRLSAAITYRLMTIR